MNPSTKGASPTSPLNPGKTLGVSTQDEGGGFRSHTFTQSGPNDSVFRRTVSSVGYMMGVEGISNEEWTANVIRTLQKADDHKPAGDFSMPAVFANKKDFWVTFFLTAIGGIVLGFIALCYLNFVDYIPKQWTDNFQATTTSNYFTCDSSCQANADDIIKQTTDPFDNTIDDPCECDKYKNYNFYKGKKSWIAVPVIAGFIVSLLRYFGNYPDRIPGLYEELNKCHVNYKWAPLTFVISAISLAGGATLGPEAGMANFGGGFMCWVEEKIGHKLIEDEEYKRLFVLGGFAAVFGSLFPTPVLGVMICLELCDHTIPKTYMASILILFAGAIPAWLVFYAVEKDTTLLYYSDDSMTLAFQWDFNEKNCATGLIIGFICALIGFMSALFIGFQRRIFGVIKLRMLQRNKPYLSILLPLLISGVAIGSVNYALPMTVGYGSLVVKNLVTYGKQGKFSNHLLLSSVFARHFLLGCSMGGGWVGGFILPTITIAVMWAIICYQIYAAAPYGLYISCFMASLCCTLAPCPVTFTALTCFLFFFGLYQTVPIFIAAVTSYTLLMGTGLLQHLTNSNAKAKTEIRESIIELPSSDATLQQDEYQQTLYMNKKKSNNYEPPNV